MNQAEQRVRGLALWQGPIALEVLKGGVSNAGFKVVDGTGSYVARVGEDYPFHQVSREREAIAARAAFHAGLSPEVVHTQSGIMVLRFLEARTYGEADVRARWQACVEIVKRCHQNMPKRILGQVAIFWVFQILRDYAATLVDKRHARAGEVSRWMKIVDALEAAQVPLPIIFGHHDLLPTNLWMMANGCG